MRLKIARGTYVGRKSSSSAATCANAARYRAGLFLNADLAKPSDDNERNCFIIKTASGARIGVVQIAGLIARRIVPFVREGTAIGAGQRIGIFGSAPVWRSIYRTWAGRWSRRARSPSPETIIADLHGDPVCSYRVG
jgi:phosphatidylserine decarboxylase